MKALCFFDWRVDSLFRVQQVDILSMEFHTQSPKYQNSIPFPFWAEFHDAEWYLGWMKALCFFDWRVDSLYWVRQVATRRTFNGIPHPEPNVPQFEFV